MAGLLAGCASGSSSSLNPVNWWQGLQGGKIAEERPPPPGAGDPDPNLASIPERPVPTDPKFREQLANALIADRENAQHLAARTPVGDPSSPAASPSLFGRGAMPPPPPAPAAPTSVGAPAIATAPVGAVRAENVEAPASPSQAAPLPDQPPTAPVLEDVTTRPPPAVTPAPAPESLPPLPANPPPSANLPGAPASRPVPPPRPNAASLAETAEPEPTAGLAPVSVAFGPGSSALPRAAGAALRQLAAKRGRSAIAVTGYGDATSGEPAAQSAALALGLARGQAIANALIGAGVPANIIRVDAEASGRGGAARLVE